jgi:hypothetical protein
VLPLRKTRRPWFKPAAKSDVVKAMVWLHERADFPGFNSVFAEYFPTDPPARSAVLNQLLMYESRSRSSLTDRLILLFANLVLARTVTRPEGSLRV